MLRERVTFVLGFENDQELGEKHVLQLVVVFALSQILVDPNSEVARATLGYSETSTTRRSPEGGIRVRRPADLQHHPRSADERVERQRRRDRGDTTGAYGRRQPGEHRQAGAWDVTPQVREWLASGRQKGTLVLGADDQPPDIRGQSMCLSYLIDLGLSVEVAPKP